MKAYRPPDIVAHTFAKHRREKIALRDAHECAWALAKDGRQRRVWRRRWAAFDALMQGKMTRMSVSDLFPICAAAHKTHFKSTPSTRPSEMVPCTQARPCRRPGSPGRWP